MNLSKYVTIPVARTENNLLQEAVLDKDHTGQETIEGLFSIMEVIGC